MKHKSGLSIAFLLVTQLLVVSLFTPLDISGGSMTPHVMYGYVTDSAGVSLSPATVFINHSAESLNTTTDLDGRYSIDISTYPSDWTGWANKTLDITVLYFKYANTSMVNVNESTPAQEHNISVPLTSHMIEGFIYLPNNNKAQYFPLNVTNQALGEKQSLMSNASGWYRMDLARYQSYSLGDAITVDCDYIGFIGLNSTVVSNGSSQQVDLWLSDNEPPNVSLFEAPTNVTLGQGFNIVVYATDNSGIASVFLHVKEVGDAMFSLREMHQDDGSTYDWDSDSQQDSRLYGITIQGQTNIGFVYYYIEVSDGTLASTIPASDPEGSPLAVEIRDIVAPVITHTPQTSLEAGSELNVIAKVTDNIAVGGARLWYTWVGNSTYLLKEMALTGEPDEYNTSIPAQSITGVLNYYLTANDTSGNAARFPTSGSIAVNVTDTTPPSLSHIQINSANLNDPINFTAQASDLIGVKTVWLNYSDVHGVNFPFTMNPWGAGNWSYVNSSGQDATGTLYYTLWANDTSGNLMFHSYSTKICDVGTPKITHIPPELAVVKEQTNITAYLEDDGTITYGNVSLAYKGVGESLFTLVNMTSTDSDGKHGNFSALVPAQPALGVIQYYINASDGTNNISWPALAPNYTLDVKDNKTPAFSSLSYPLNVSINSSASVFLNVSDNFMVDKVFIFYRNTTNASWQGLEMSNVSSLDATGSGMYLASLPGQSSVGNLSFYCWANDTSGNNASLPAALPKLNPYNITVLDNRAPEIIFVPPGQIYVNNTTNLYVNVTDDHKVSEVVLRYQLELGTSYLSQNFTKLDDVAYLAIFPVQNHSRIIHILVTASDGTNLNQTQTYAVTVLNIPPVIEHSNWSFSAVGEPLTIFATVKDDLRVEKVEVYWRVKGNTSYSNVSMSNTVQDGYQAAIGPFAEPLTIEYHITARDIENFTVWPNASYDAELKILDVTPPVIVHQQLTELAVGEMPIITANVSDDIEVASVEIFFMNSAMSGYSGARMSLASGNATQGQYAVLLNRQPVGDFSYYIQASDGNNTARFPADSVITVEVSGRPFGVVPLMVLLIVIILLAIALVLIYIRLKGKNIKQ